jgi:hypothetical protein
MVTDTKRTIVEVLFLYNVTEGNRTNKSFGTIGTRLRKYNMDIDHKHRYKHCKNNFFHSTIRNMATMRNVDVMRNNLNVLQAMEAHRIARG